MRKTNAYSSAVTGTLCKHRKRESFKVWIQIGARETCTPSTQSPSHNPPLSKHQTFVPPIRAEDFGKTNKSHTYLATLFLLITYVTADLTQQLFEKYNFYLVAFYQTFNSVAYSLINFIISNMIQLLSGLCCITKLDVGKE